MEEKDFIGHSFEQKCGDTLFVIEKSNKKTTKQEVLYHCKFLKYPCEVYVQKSIVLKGLIANPDIDKYTLFGKEFPQACGDILRVIKKSDKKDKWGKFLYECEFLKYPFKILALRNHIQLGKVNNPQIEQVEFVEKIWPQHCGDSLRIIEKCDKYWKCEFIKYPYITLATKAHILEGCVLNPQIEQDNFVNKIWAQNCGDYIRVLKKSDKKANKDYLWECEFINYPAKVTAKKDHILNGLVDNPGLPYKSKERLVKFIKDNFKNRKPNINELASKMKMSPSRVGRAINEFNLRTYISYYENHGEASLREFISQFIDVHPEEYYFCDKNGKYYGIDVYIPSLNIGFEYNGDYWHSELFKEPIYHQRKSLAAVEQGIQLFHIWEYEWSDPIKRPIIESLIKSKLGIFSQKIGASKCKIVDLSYKKYSDFCNENHIQGEAGAKVKLGLVYEGKLVQVMSFGAPRFADTIEWEIIRECSKSDTIVLGGKEKLWNFFLKKYNPKSVLSYCDYSKFNGSSYLKLGFKKSRLNKPGFVWYDEKNRNIHWRNPYKHKEYSKKFIKVWDCGQLVFVWKSFE
jgi:hypothetical protein